jgi:hypothetical protein
MDRVLLQCQELHILYTGLLGEDAHPLTIRWRVHTFWSWEMGNVQMNESKYD